MTDKLIRFAALLAVFFYIGAARAADNIITGTDRIFTTAGDDDTMASIGEATDMGFVALRAANYRFATDAPDFFNSNVVGNNVEFPSFAGHHSIVIADLPEAELHRAEVGVTVHV